MDNSQTEDEQWWAIAGLKRLDISNNERLTCDEPGWADLAAHAETFQGFVAHNNAIAQLPAALWDCAQLHTLAMSRYVGAQCHSQARAAATTQRSHSPAHFTGTNYEYSQVTLDGLKTW